MPLIASFIAWLLSFLTPAIQKLFFDYSRKTLVLGTTFGALVSCYAVFLFLVKEVLNSIIFAMPAVVEGVWAWFMPSNFYFCLISVLSARIARVIYEKCQSIITLSGKVLAD
jgi:glucose uptake protein GlcU